jgi:hypothetical protein
MRRSSSVRRPMSARAASTIAAIGAPLGPSV